MSTSNPNYNTPVVPSETGHIKSMEHPEFTPTVADGLKQENEFSEANINQTVASEGVPTKLSEDEERFALGAIIGNSDSAKKIMKASADGVDPKQVIADMYRGADLTPHEVLEKGEDPSNIVEGLYGNPTSEIK